jgi:LPS sulfotransferase NodH
MTTQSRFCVLSTRRSGSTYLVSLLNSHPAVEAFEELFLMRPAGERLSWVGKGSPERFYYFRHKTPHPRPLSTVQYLNFVHSRGPAHGAVGFKLMVPQARALPELLVALPLLRYRIIFLVRSNVFEQCISDYVSRSSRIPHSLETFPVEPIHVDPVRLIRDMQRIIHVFRITHSLLSVLPVACWRLQYERLRMDPIEECRHLFEFLNVDPDVIACSPLKKRVTVPYSTIIENYAEVSAALADAGFGGYLLSDR